MSIVKFLETTIIKLSMTGTSAIAQNKLSAPKKKDVPTAPQPKKIDPTAPTPPPNPPITKPNDLIIEDLKINDSAKTKTNDIIAMNYVNTLRATEIEFDSTTKKNEPLNCILKKDPNNVITN